MATTLPIGLAVYAICAPFARHNPAPRLFLAGISRIVGLRITVHGRQPASDRLILANHISWLDIAALGAVSGCAFVANDGLARHAWLRWLCRLSGTVFVARHNRRSVTDQIEQVREAIHANGALAIFPEGTTGDGVDLLPFKSSLLSALSPLPQGLSVQPVWLDYGPHTADIAWLGDEPGWDNFLMIAARRKPVELTVHLLEPLSGETLIHRKSIAGSARAAIAARQAGRA